MYIFLYIFISVECDDSNGNYCPLCGICYDEESLTKHMWKCHSDVMGPKKRGRPKKILTSVSVPSYHLIKYKIDILTE